MASILVKTSKGFKGPLHAGTIDLHHAVEETQLGKVMSTGQATVHDYAAWLAMEAPIYAKLDPVLPEPFRRSKKIAHDRGLLPLKPPCRTTTELAAEFKTERWLTAATYVMLGSVLMGGAVIAKALPDHYPKSSFVVPHRDFLLWHLKQLRQRGDCVYEARMVFAHLLQACNELKRD